MRCCMCSTGVPAVWSLYVLSMFPLGFSHYPNTYRSRYWWIWVCVCVWHPCDGLAIYPGGFSARHREGSSLVTLHRTSAREDVWNRWMDGWMFSTVRDGVLPLSLSHQSHQCVFPDPYFQTKSFRSHPFTKRDKKERKKERKKGRRRRRWRWKD